MRHPPDSDKKPGRGPLYLIGGILLALTMTGFWFWDDLATLFERTPVESDLAGAWIFDAERSKTQLVRIYGSDQQLPAMEKSYGQMQFVFAPGTVAMDSGNGSATALACTIQGYPPDGYLVTIGDNTSRREFAFQLMKSEGVKTLYMSTESGMVPFRLKD